MSVPVVQVFQTVTGVESSLPSLVQQLPKGF